MNAIVTKDVIRDLLPLYLAGEASADTRALIERCMAEDPQLRLLVESAAEPLPELPPPPDVEKRAIHATQRLLTRKTWLLAVAIACTAIPLSFSFSGSKVTRLAVDHPVAATCSLVTALACWALFLHTCRRLSTKGMEPPRSYGTRFGWSLMGGFIFLSIGTVIDAWTGWTPAMYLFPPIGMVTLWLAERLGQVATPEQTGTIK